MNAAWLAAGYALVMCGAAWGLRARAGKPGETWVAADAVWFARAIALVPLAVADAVLVAATVLDPSAAVVLLPLFAGISLAAGREVAALRASR